MKGWNFAVGTHPPSPASSSSTPRPQVKERTTDTTGLHTEVAQMLRHAYHSGATAAPGKAGLRVGRSAEGPLTPACTWSPLSTCPTPRTASRPACSHQPLPAGPHWGR